MASDTAAIFRIWIGMACLLWPALSTAVEDIEYVGEHLPEGAMNLRLGSLPLWGPSTIDWRFTAQAAWGAVRGGDISLRGPLTAIAAQRRVAARWTLSGYGFYDRLRFSGEGGTRPLEVRFARSTPLALPADALFGRVGGTARDYGIGFALGREVDSGWLQGWRVTAGAQFQRLSLVDYSVPFRLLTGGSAGATGTVDYSHDYDFVTGMLGVSRRFERNDWAYTPHALLALVLPRRGVQGHITGPGFDVAGSTADAGRGKHYGDPALTLGAEVEYRPWRAALDLGALVTQPLTEPAMHKGLDSSLLLSLTLRF